MPKAQSRDTIIKTAIALAGGVAQSDNAIARARTQSIVCGMLATLSLPSKKRQSVIDQLTGPLPDGMEERDHAFNTGARWALGIPLGYAGPIIDAMLAKGRNNMDLEIAEEIN